MIRGAGHGDRRAPPVGVDRRAPVLGAAEVAARHCLENMERVAARAAAAWRASTTEVARLHPPKPEEVAYCEAMAAAYQRQAEALGAQLRALEQPQPRRGRPEGRQ